MTDDEHVARALLLGAVYKAWLKCYVKTIAVHDGRPASSTEQWFDAETLEELDHQQKFDRLSKSVWNGSYVP